MNKEQATIYMKNTTNMKVLSKKFQYEFLFINLVLLIFSFVFYRNLMFIVIVLSVALLYLAATIVIARKKTNFCAITGLGSIHLTIVCIAFNFCVYAIYQEFGGFILWVYLSSIGIQVVALFLSIPIVINYVKKFKPRAGIAKSEVIAGSMAGLTCALTRILLQVFAPSPSIAGDTMAIITTLIGVLISLGIFTAFYRAYLIKKFKLNINYAE